MIYVYLIIAIYLLDLSGTVSTAVAVAGLAIGVISSVIVIYINWRMVQLEKKIIDRMDSRIKEIVFEIEREMATKGDIASLRENFDLKIRLAVSEISKTVRENK